MKKYLLLGLIISLICIAPVSAFSWSKKSPEENTVKLNNSSGLENFVTRSVDSLSHKERPADIIFEQAFYNVVEKISGEKEFIKLKKKIVKIRRSNKYEDSEKNILITNIVTNYTKGLNENQIGYIAAIAKLSEAEQKKLIESLNILSMNGQHYVDLVLQARAYEDNVKRVNNKPDNYTELVNNINSKGNEIRSKANAALNLSNKVRQLIKYAGVILD